MRWNERGEDRRNEGRNDVRELNEEGEVEEGESERRRGRNDVTGIEREEGMQGLKEKKRKGGRRSDAYK